MQNKFLGTGEPGFRPIRKIRGGLRGTWYAIRFDFAVAYKLALSIPLLVACFHYKQWLDFGVILVATGMMLVAEMFNTTIEALCDFLVDEQNEKIGIIKDIAAAAAGVSIFVWTAVIVTESIRVWGLLQN